MERIDEPDDVRAARDELADVARRIAQLLAQPRYDEAELAELDARANALREHLRESAPSPAERLDLVDDRRSGGLTSGG